MIPLMTAREVAELFGVNVETVLRWTRRGTLPAIRLPGGALRYRQDALDGWLEQRATPGPGVLPTSPDAAPREPYPARVGSPPLPTNRPRARSVTEAQED